MDSKSFVYRDARMAELVAQAEAAATGAANILIEGLPGTGRSTLAQHILRCGGHDVDALTPIHCAAMQPNWMEDAMPRTGGALLLLDVCALSGAAQAELALALGAGNAGPRVIATASSPLAEAVRCGKFRGDLYYRLGVVHFHLPALAERPDDLPVLATHFADAVANAQGLPPRAISSDALAKLAGYHWPGNVQELENVMHRAVLFAEGAAIGAHDLRLPNALGSSGGDPVSAALVGRTVADVERDLILHTLRHCDGNRTQAAEILGISVRTLRNKIRQYLEEGEEVPAFSRAA